MMESDLAQTRARFEEALEWVKSVHQVVMLDLPRATEVSFLRSSLAPWSFTGCLSTPASCFVGLGGDVEPQVLFSPRGARSNGAGGHGIVVGRRARALAGVHLQ